MYNFHVLPACVRIMRAQILVNSFYIIDGKNEGRKTIFLKIACMFKEINCLLSFLIFSRNTMQIIK